MSELARTIATATLDAHTAARVITPPGPGRGVFHRAGYLQRWCDRMGITDAHRVHEDRRLCDAHAYPITLDTTVIPSDGL